VVAFDSLHTSMVQTCEVEPYPTHQSHHQHIDLVPYRQRAEKFCFHHHYLFCTSQSQQPKPKFNLQTKCILRNFGTQQSILHNFGTQQSIFYYELHQSTFSHYVHSLAALYETCD